MPTAAVKHFIPKARQTTRFIRSYYLGHGVYHARSIYHDLPGATLLFGKPRWLWRKALEAELRYRLDRCFRRPEVWIKSLRKCSLIWGRLQGSTSTERLEDLLVDSPVPRQQTVS